MKKIETEHLQLRLITENDVHYLEELDQDEEVKKFFPSGVLDKSEIKKMINKFIQNHATENLPCFVFFEKESNEFVGRSNFGKLDTGEVKVAYLVNKKFWNQGYATEILTALIEWAKVNLSEKYIYAYADKENQASIHVMENCGMEFYKEDFYLGMLCHFYRIKIG